MRWIAVLVLALLPASTVQGSGPPSRPSYKDFDRKPVTLSTEELALIRQRIAGRCGVHPEGDLTRAPWYFHYELALELARRGDSQRALDALIDATEHRPRPERGARMYGVWFTDYLPYFHLARLHAELGNWACAEDALRLSRETEEVSQTDPEAAELEQLSAQTAAARERERQRPPGT